MDLSLTLVAVIAIVVLAVVIVFWQHVYPFVLIALAALLIFLIVKIIQHKNARCMICGDQIKFLDYLDGSKVRPWLKNRDFYKNVKPGAKPHCCDFCNNQFAKLESEYKIYGNYPMDNMRSYKKGSYTPPYIKSLEQSIKNNTFHVNIDPKLFAETVNNMYAPLKRLEDAFRENNKAITAAIEMVESDIVIREKRFNAKYPNLISPKEQKHNHLSATRDGNQLVLVENTHPKVPSDYKTDKKRDYLEDEFVPQMLKMDDKDMFAVTIIPMEDIVSFQLVGNIDRVTTTSGGGGGGGQPNLGGALLGGLLFGTAGAIIGAQTGIYIDPIKSSTTEYDTRKTLLNIKNAQGVAETKELPFYYAEVFTKVIPEKEFSFIQAEKSSDKAIKEEKAQDTNSIEALKKFKELLDMGVITQEEFDAKKKQLLDL